MTPAANCPPLVQEAITRSQALRFELSCEDFVGQLLSVLSANVRPDGRILELGTGVGVGLAWIVSGLSNRTDVAVVSVEIDEALLSEVRQSNWPEFVQFVQGDGAEEVSRRGEFDLIFADAPGGKLSNIEGAISALRLSGLLVVDDMGLAQHSDDAALQAGLQEVTRVLLTDRRLRCVECPISSGVILAVRCS